MRGEAWLVLAALTVEACLGYPQSLFSRIRHPVVWIGAFVGTLEGGWNRASLKPGARRTLGSAALLIVVASAIGLGYVLERLLGTHAVGVAILVLTATSGLAQRSLYVHVRDVDRALAADNLSNARSLVARIVGRDTANLSTSEVSAAAVESLAESFNDAVVAPTFWLLVGGLPGLFAYKAINTADSMVGHMEERWRAFGWASARADDLANLVPARLAAVLLVAAARGGFLVMLRDARKHASPNAGWPEAAMAGGLKVRLGGPASYDGVSCERPTFGDGAPPQPADLGRALHVYVAACALLWLLLMAVALVAPGI